jgi:predicted RNA-binding protein
LLQQIKYISWRYLFVNNIFQNKQINSNSIFFIRPEAEHKSLVAPFIVLQLTKITKQANFALTQGENKFPILDII